MEIDRMWFCGYIGRLPSGWLKRLALISTFPLSATHINCDSWIWCFTLTSTLCMTTILTCAEYCHLLRYNCSATYCSLSADAHAFVKKSFINHRLVRILVLSYLTSNEDLNLHYNCLYSVMVEQGINYSKEHQAWSRVQRIGQQQTQLTTWLVYLCHG